MSKNQTPMYNGEIQANRVGCFVKAGLQLHVVRPGYDTQGRRRQDWTQVVHDGVPLYTAKMPCPIPDFLRRFDALWDFTFNAGGPEFLQKCLAANRKAHLDRFKDGITGESPAPTHTRDGKMQAKVQQPS